MSFLLISESGLPLGVLGGGETWGWFIHCRVFFALICFSLEVAVLTLCRSLGFFFKVAALALILGTSFFKLGNSALI